MKYQIVITLNMLAILLIATSTTKVAAEIKPEDEIKFRQSGMMFMRWNMGKIKKQLSTKSQTYDKEEVVAAANVVAAIANSGLGALFTPRTKTGKGWKETRLKPEYFQQSDEVKKLATAFNKEANQLAKVASYGDIKQLKIQFDTVFKTCKGCHKKFRSKNF